MFVSTISLLSQELFPLTLGFPSATDSDKVSIVSFESDSRPLSSLSFPEREHLSPSLTRSNDISLWRILSLSIPFLRLKLRMSFLCLVISVSIFFFSISKFSCRSIRFADIWCRTWFLAAIAYENIQITWGIISRHNIFNNFWKFRNSRL